MNNNEALSRREELHNLIVTFTAQALVTSFLTRCLHANTEHCSDLGGPFDDDHVGRGEWEWGMR